MALGLSNNLELIETAMGAFYCFSLMFNADGWLAQNLKGKTTPKVRFLTQLAGIICLGLRLSVHYARVGGGGGELFGHSFDYFARRKNVCVRESGALRVHVASPRANCAHCRVDGGMLRFALAFFAGHHRSR